MTDEGFRAFLDDSELTLGAIEEPDGDDESGDVDVTFSNGDCVTVDAIGVDEVAGTATVYGFNWASYSEERVREIADEKGVSFEEATQGVDLDAQFLMLEFAAPWGNVVVSEMNTYGVVQ